MENKLKKSLHFYFKFDNTTQHEDLPMAHLEYILFLITGVH